MVGVREHATALADGVQAALPGWVEGCVRRTVAAAGVPFDDAMASATADAVEAARADVMPRMRALLEADVDEQRTTPLAILRSAVRHPAGVLSGAGVAPVERDEAQARLFPDDVYDLAPASFADVDTALVEPALAWGAAKAWTHRRRHGAARPGKPSQGSLAQGSPAQ